MNKSLQSNLFQIYEKINNKVVFFYYFFYHYLFELGKQWTSKAFLLFGFIDLTYYLSDFEYDNSQFLYRILATMCLIIANNEVVREKKYSKITKPNRNFNGHTFKINSLSLSSDGKKIVSSSDRVAIVWETRSGKISNRLQSKTWIGNALFVNCDQKVIGIGGKGFFFQWDAISGKQVKKPCQIIESDSVALAISPMENMISAAGQNGNISFWDYPNLNLLNKTKMGDVEVRKLLFFKKKSLLVACDVLGKVAIYNYQTNFWCNIFQHPENEPIRSIDLSEDEKKLGFIDGAGNVYCYIIDENRLLETFKGHSDMGLCCRFNESSEFLATGGQDNQIILWKIKEKKIRKLFSISGHTDAVTSLIFDLHSNNLYSSSRDMKIKYWTIGFLLKS
jgi:WD40 repeat protein